jgi:pre-mRNA-splicing factor CDC5/CEF1
MDYNAEIPFEKRPAVGFFDPSADDKFKASDQFVKRSLQQLEPEKRMDKEMEERKRDAKKQRVAKEKNLPAVMKEINAMNDPESTLRRSKLAMPAPQITDDELAEVARLGRGKNMAELDDGETATSTLLADYATAAPTPMRTPMRTPQQKSDVVLTEAQNLIALTNQQTPLAAEENVQLHASDFSGITPQRQASATPNPIATPGGSLVRGSVRGSMRGSVRSTPGGMTPGQTPLRDELRINSELTEEEAQERMLRMQVMSGLSQLPGPKNEYQIQVRLLTDPPAHLSYLRVPAPTSPPSFKFLCGGG